MRIYIHIYIVNDKVSPIYFPQYSTYWRELSSLTATQYPLSHYEPPVKFLASAGGLGLRVAFGANIL